MKLDNDLSLNWVKKNAKSCPDCQEMVCLIGLNTRRVRCPKCNTKDFCYDCLEKWKADKNGKCDNTLCITKRDLLENGQLTRKFSVRDKKTGNLTDIFTPEYRACPRECGNIINNYTACKHTQCPCVNMAYSFCFICLGLYENDKWPCGSYSDYCGITAPPQKAK